MNRARAIKNIIKNNPDAFFIFSNGLTSREAAHFADQGNNFYLLHAMGEALSVGIGLAKANPRLTVVVIDGDGNALMGMASWSMMPVENLVYYVLKNSQFETTGGQPLPPLPVLPEWCRVIEIVAGKAETPNPPEPEKVWSRSRLWLRSQGF